MSLKTYQHKRNFDETPEPKGRERQTGQRRFVVQEHHATQLHFDFRLEMEGVLKSWAIPKGPSLDPADKRLAVAVEDHPVDYIDFQGEIAEGNYGAGRVVVWDHGSYEPVPSGNPGQALASGKLKFILSGEVLKGEFNLVKLGRGEDQWLLIKAKDAYARPGWVLQPRLGAVSSGNGRPRRKTATSRRAARPKPTNGRTATSTKATPHKNGKKPAPGLKAVPGAEAAPMPEQVDPMLATLVDRPFSDPNWLFETKWDGVRALVYLAGGQPRLISRNQKDMSARYPELAGLAESVAAPAIFDGEIVALDEDGRSRFQLLQARVGLQEAGEIKRLAARRPVSFRVFDLLYYDGFDLRPGALADRKALLEAVLRPGDAVRISEHSSGNGEAAFRDAQARGLEGIIAKRRDSVYLAGRAGGWLKIKALRQQEVVVGGYTAPRRSRAHFGALVAGVYQDGQLVYTGHVGGGFDRDSLAQVYALLQPLKTKRSPFADPPSTNEAVTWVRPKLVAEVKFAEWTSDHRMRQPIFLGLRDDKPPAEVTLEQPRPLPTEKKQAARAAAATAVADPEAPPEEGPTLTAASAFGRRATALSGTIHLKLGRETLTLTHMDKLYWLEAGYRKADLLRYYWQISPTMLPHLAGRPLILKRYPNGAEAPSFFQHDVNAVPSYVRTLSAEAESGRLIDYVICENAATLLYLANLGTIEQNPWQSRAADLDHPDWIVLDLDPGEVAYRAVCDLALAVRDVFDRLGLMSYPKTSGARGLHVYVPIQAKYSYAQTAQLAERVAAAVVHENPGLATLERSKTKRPPRRVYVDHLQNARGKTVVAAYSVRARPEATVSMPLQWSEVKHGVDPADYTIATAPGRVARLGDLFEPVLSQKQSLDAAIRTAADLAKERSS